MYSDCPVCGPVNLSALSLSTDKGINKQVFIDAVKYLHEKGSYTSDMLSHEKVKALFNEVNNSLSSSISKIETYIPEELLLKLKSDVFVFSGCKTEVELREASSMLLDAAGKPVSWNAFRDSVLKVHSTYNEQYLEAEYNFATQSAEMAARWADQAADADKYNLQYRTAGDERVRASHQALNRTTLPASDGFWDSYYPPNGWRCRCTVVQVLKDKYPQSDSAKASEEGRKATTHIDKNGVNRMEMFRFNPGKQAVIFPPHHPYFKVKDVVIKQLSQESVIINKKLKNTSDLSDVIKRYADEYPTFKNGFKSITGTRKSGVNGYTDRNGNIALSNERIKRVIEGFNNIREGVKTTIDQEDAIATLWHEITHNKNGERAILDKGRRNGSERQHMELANEFVSRKTLKTFFKNLGGTLQNEELINDRPSTGYNKWVRKFDKLIEFSGADPSKVLNDVSKHLFNESYTDQKTGLINAIASNSNMSEATIKKALHQCFNDYSNEESFQELLKSIKVK